MPKMAGNIAERSEIWDSELHVVLHVIMWDTFDLLLKVIWGLFGALVSNLPVARTRLAVG